MGMIIFALKGVGGVLSIVLPVASWLMNRRWNPTGGVRGIEKTKGF